MRAPAASGRVPAHDLDAEAAVLSTVFLDPKRIAELSFLAPEHFYSDANRRIFDAMAEIDGSGRTVDMVTVVSLLTDRGRLAQVGGSPYLYRIADATPAVVNVVEHAQIVFDKWRVRRLVEACQRVAAEGYADVGEVDDWVQGSEATVYAATDTRSTNETLVVMHDAVEAEHQAIRERSHAPQRLNGSATGLPTLDKILLGMRDGAQYVVAGRPGHGKSGLALSLTLAVAQQGRAAIFVSVEMPREQVVQRAIAQLSGVSTSRLASGYLDGQNASWDDVARAVGILSKLPIAIDDRVPQTVAGIRSSARRGMQKLRQRFGPDLKPGLVVVDYLQLVKGERHKGDTREAEVASVSQGCLAIGRELRCPTLVVSQLNREIERRDDKVPTLADLRESGAIEQDAYGVIFVYRPDAYRKGDEVMDGKAMLTVAKHRNGRLGRATVEFVAKTTRFYEESPPPPDEWWDD